MAQQVGEHLGAYAQVDLAGGVRMAQHVAAEIGRVEPGRPGMLDDDVADGRGTAQRTERHLHLDEDMPGRGVRRPTVAQVERQRLGDGRQQRQREGDAGLRAHDPERGGIPVESSNCRRITSPAPKP